MLQQKKPDDYVIATGKSRSVRDFVKKAFKVLNIEIKWKGKLSEIGYDSKTKKTLIKMILTTIDLMKFIILEVIIQKQKKFWDGSPKHLLKL